MVVPSCHFSLEFHLLIPCELNYGYAELAPDSVVRHLGARSTTRVNIPTRQASRPSAANLFLDYNWHASRSQVANRSQHG